MENCHSTPGTVKGHTKYLGDTDNFLLSTLHRLRGKLYSKHTLLGRNKHCKKYIVRFRVSHCVDCFLLLQRDWCFRGFGSWTKFNMI